MYSTKKTVVKMDILGKEGIIFFFIKLQTIVPNKVKYIYLY